MHNFIPQTCFGSAEMGQYLDDFAVVLQATAEASQQDLYLMPVRDILEQFFLLTPAQQMDLWDMHPT